LTPQQINIQSLLQSQLRELMQQPQRQMQPQIQPQMQLQQLQPQMQSANGQSAEMRAMQEIEMMKLQQLQATQKIEALQRELQAARMQKDLVPTMNKPGSNLANPAGNTLKGLAAAHHGQGGDTSVQAVYKGLTSSAALAGQSLLSSLGSASTQVQNGSSAAFTSQRNRFPPSQNAGNQFALAQTEQVRLILRAKTKMPAFPNPLSYPSFTAVSVKCGWTEY
jgi:hypothetical protein